MFFGPILTWARMLSIAIQPLNSPPSSLQQADPSRPLSFSLHAQQRRNTTRPIIGYAKPVYEYPSLVSLAFELS
jgi:hypothetical protein